MGPKRASILHALQPLRRELQQADTPVVRAWDALHHPGAFQAIGDLRHGADRDVEILTENRKRPRSCLQQRADPQLRYRQIGDRAVRIERE